MTLPRIKGTSINMTVDFVRAERGEVGVAAMRSALPPAVQQALPPDLRVLPATQWSFETWAEVLLGAERLFTGVGSIARRTARQGYTALLATAYKNWVVPGDPQKSLQRMPRLWKQVTSGLGDYDVAPSDEPDQVVIRLRLTVPERYRALTEERVAGTLEAMVEAASGHATVTVVPQGKLTDVVVKLEARRGLRPGGGTP